MTTGHGEGRTHGTRRRESIIRAAIELFGEVGYRAATLRDIAARADITHPGLLYHFGSKEDLLTAVLEHRDTEQDELLVPENPTADQLFSALYALVADNAAQQGMVEMFATLSAEALDASHPAHEYFRRRYSAMRDQYVGLARVLESSGVLRPGVRPETVAVNLIALVDGLQLQWLYEPGSIDMTAQVKAFINWTTVHEFSAEPPAV